MPIGPLEKSRVASYPEILTDTTHAIWGPCCDRSASLALSFYLQDVPWSLETKYERNLRRELTPTLAEQELKAFCANKA